MVVSLVEMMAELFAGMMDLSLVEMLVVWMVEKTAVKKAQEKAD